MYNVSVTVEMETRTTYKKQIWRAYRLLTFHDNSRKARLKTNHAHAAAMTIALPDRYIAGHKSQPRTMTRVVVHPIHNATFSWR